VCPRRRAIAGATRRSAATSAGRTRGRWTRRSRPPGAATAPCCAARPCLCRPRGARRWGCHGVQPSRASPPRHRRARLASHEHSASYLSAVDVVDSCRRRKRFSGGAWSVQIFAVSDGLFAGLLVVRRRRCELVHGRVASRRADRSRRTKSRAA
jgi:hypothetical protein